MRRLAAALLVLSLAGAAQAQPPEPARRGYAFEHPRVLAEQRLFGIAHGVGLLATACRDLPAAGEVAEDAYRAWHAAQRSTIDAAAADLARYHFGVDAADWSVIAQVLSLKDRIELAADDAELQAACTTLPQALAQPRYALGERLRLEELMAQSLAALDVEAHAAYCHPRMPAEALPVSEAHYEVWYEINAPLLAQAHAELAAAWPADAAEASFAAWLAAQRRELHAAGSVAACLEFSAALKQPQAALRNVFKAPPLAQEPHPK